MIIPKGIRVKITVCQILILHNSKLFTHGQKTIHYEKKVITIKHACARPTKKLGDSSSWTTEWYLQLME